MWGGGGGGRGRGRCAGSVECGWVGTWGLVGVWAGECACGGSKGVHIGVDGCMYVCVLVGAVCVVYTPALRCLWCVHVCHAPLTNSQPLTFTNRQ